MRRFYIIFILLLLFTISGHGYPVVAEDKADPAETDSPPPGTIAYALIMSNGMKLRVSEYSINLEKETVFFKSNLSGLSATFPLERIQRVVSFDSHLTEVPDDAMPLFIPEKTVGTSVDDGGIPVLFKVNKTVVGASGSNGGYSRTGSNSSPRSSRQNYTPSKSTGSSSSSSGFSSSSTCGSSGRTMTSNNASSESSSSADNFINALFGGN